MEQAIEVELGCTVYASDEAKLYGYKAGTHRIVASMSSGIRTQAYLQGEGWADVEHLTVVSKAKPFLYVTEPVYKALYAHGVNMLVLETYIEEHDYAYAIISDKTFNSTRDKPLNINEDNGDIMAGKQSVRIGRLFRALMPKAKDEDIELFVSKHKTMYTIDTSIVKTSNNIAEIYNIGRVGGSCMANVPDEWFDIYQDAGSSIAYILNDNGSLRARGLIHEVVHLDGEKKGKTSMILDRVFYDDEAAKLTLQKWRREQGEEWDRIMYCGNVRSIKEIRDNYDGVPYIDNMCYASYVDGGLYLTNDNVYNTYDYMQETEGGSESGNISYGGEDYVWCEDVQERHHIDDCYHVENMGEFYRYDGNLRLIGDYWYDVVNDDDFQQAEDTQEYAHVDDLYYDSYNEEYYAYVGYVVEVDYGKYDGDWIHQDNAVHCHDIDDYVSDEDMVYYLEDEDLTYFYRDGIFEHSNGKLYTYAEEDEVEEA